MCLTPNKARLGSSTYWKSSTVPANATICAQPLKGTLLKAAKPLGTSVNFKPKEGDKSPAVCPTVQPWKKQDLNFFFFKGKSLRLLNLNLLFKPLGEEMGIVPKSTNKIIKLANLSLMFCPEGLASGNILGQCTRGKQTWPLFHASILHNGVGERRRHHQSW